MKSLFSGLLLACSLPALADDALIARPDVQAFINKVVAEHGLSREAVTASLQAAEKKPNILTILDRPSTARPWYQFRPAHVNSRLETEGAAFWRQHAAALADAEARYGVDPEAIVAILGIESGYGRNMGSFRVLDALSTIGFDYPRRAAFFQNELAEFLTLAREEKADPQSFKGSYAGAMGMAQFMPSSFRQWAVDGNGDGRRDIWGTPADAIASVANYLKQHGWQHGADIILPVSVNPAMGEKLAAEKFNLHYSAAELRGLGVDMPAGVPDQVQAVVYPLETQAGVTEYWMGLQNFYTITRYNKSTLYATAVAQLANNIKLRWAMQEAYSGL
ncbi:lytic murein transglycosylase B [Laribacter hongkongensis]|uniref:Lytic murein transglycosylase B n=2 Tax=Laribacter hongkongensis TaxID=168471 RepID=A0AAW5DCB2_9NEIS|nr:lytic murein transglycosylase B [Laribacter hongkongensis]MCG9004175.1 lytic murein transglycosylase B [Laribacter hongkongensis]MCG9009282.1 lytic murein transglycosylase B [Laribacter hongkongensis]MCG9013816.1 lytic murein transglycosylase B [Laribacter hongkongensis]MCG9019144.1 lytic murein transglycosylase B [Laribacter hongkongensis]MCG9022799.1 lytic murein transglycosylase B [Laribacter hongkongensis]